MLGAVAQEGDAADAGVDATGDVVEFPLPRSENTMREFFGDEKGRLWFGSPANDRVGYFYLAK